MAHIYLIKNYVCLYRFVCSNHDKTFCVDSKSGKNDTKRTNLFSQRQMTRPIFDTQMMTRAFFHTKIAKIYK